MSLYNDDRSRLLNLYNTTLKGVLSVLNQDIKQHRLMDGMIALLAIVLSAILAITFGLDDGSGSDSNYIILAPIALAIYPLRKRWKNFKNVYKKNVVRKIFQAVNPELSYVPDPSETISKEISNRLIQGLIRV